MNLQGFTEEEFDTVIEIVKTAGDGGLSVNSFPIPRQALIAGYLTALSRLEIISGGGVEPYVLRVPQEKTDEAETDQTHTG